MRWRVAIAGLLAAVSLAVVVAIGGSDPSYRVTAVFASVNGLVEGAPVNVAGLEVGNVAEIDLGEDGLPRAELEIDSDYEIRQGAVANLRAGSASGQVNRFITLIPGDGEPLKEGATLGLARTDEPVEVDRILSTLDKPTRERVGDLLRGMARATAGHGADLQATLRRSAGALASTANLLGEVSADGEVLRRLVADGRIVVEELAANRDALAATAEDVGALLEVTAGRQGELAETAERLPGALEAGESALASLERQVPNLRALVADGRPGIAALVPFTGALRPTVEAARPALGEASRLVAGAGGQIQALDPLLEAADPALSELDPLLRSAGPVLDEARVRTPDFFSFFANWADFTGVYDANGHAARVGIVLGTAPLNRIDGSSAEPGHLEAPFVRTPGVLEGEPWLNYADSFIGGDGP